jgi:hypothetical protein
MEIHATPQMVRSRKYEKPKVSCDAITLYSPMAGKLRAQCRCFSSICEMAFEPTFGVSLTDLATAMDTKKRVVPRLSTGTISGRTIWDPMSLVISKPSLVHSKRIGHKPPLRSAQHYPRPVPGCQGRSVGGSPPTPGGATSTLTLLRGEGCQAMLQLRPIGHMASIHSLFRPCVATRDDRYEQCDK